MAGSIAFWLTQAQTPFRPCDSGSLIGSSSQKRVPLKLNFFWPKTPTLLLDVIVPNLAMAAADPHTLTRKVVLCNAGAGAAAGMSLFFFFFPPSVLVLGGFTCFDGEKFEENFGRKYQFY